jgi:hypothetical protein
VPLLLLSTSDGVPKAVPNTAPLFISRLVKGTVSPDFLPVRVFSVLHYLENSPKIIAPFRLLSGVNNIHNKKPSIKIMYRMDVILIVSFH